MQGVLHICSRFVSPNLLPRAVLGRGAGFLVSHLGRSWILCFIFLCGAVFRVRFCFVPLSMRVSCVSHCGCPGRLGGGFGVPAGGIEAATPVLARDLAGSVAVCLPGPELERGGSLWCRRFYR